MKKSILIIAILSFTHIGAQCKKDPNVLAAQKRINSNPNFDTKMESDYLCKAYFELACKAEYDTFVQNGQEYPRTKQHAHVIEGQAKDIIKKYNKLGMNTCGTLTPLKAIYKDSIGIREEMIVGFWLAKDVISNKTYYPEFYFDNDGHMNNSYHDSSQEKSSWKKINDTTYELSQSWYDDYHKDYTKPSVSTFIIDPTTNTAEHHFTNRRGEQLIGKFYFKGNFYHNYGKSEDEILKPVSLTINYQN